MNNFRLALAFSIALMLAVRPARSAEPATKLTFTHDIVPIVYANCVSCHRDGEVAPFPLISYNDLKKRADQIVDVTGSHYMPPWKAEPGYGHFVGERRLTDAQIKAIADWVAQGCAEGDPNSLPPLPKFPTGWTLGEPDLIVKSPKPFTVKADGNNGRDVYRCFVVPLNLTEDKYVTAVEFHPGNRKVVHHAIFYLDNTGTARRREAANTDGQPGYTTFGGPGFTPTGGLGGWAPGAMPTPLPEGWGKLLAKGSDLVIQTHFHPDGKEETEQSSLGIYFAKKKPTRIAAGYALGSFWINIPAGDPSYVVTAKMTVPIDVDLVGITPHAHLICKDMQATATLPGGQKEPLIWIKDWDFNWQGEYRYVTPLKLPAGTVIDMKYTYDNSDKNFRNPNDPPKPVHFGEQTTDEMAFLFLQFSPENWWDWPKLMQNRGARRGLRIGAGIGGSAGNPQ
jgi:mono/diheme cytochrome c family protein